MLSTVLLCLFVALSQDLYKYYGMLLALSLTNGGKAYRCICKSVYKFIVYGHAKPTIEDIPYQQTKEILSKVLYVCIKTVQVIVNSIITNWKSACRSNGRKRLKERQWQHMLMVL